MTFASRGGCAGSTAGGASFGAGFASSGALIVGKFGQMGRAAQIGASGLFWTVIGAIAFVTIYAILNGIVGNGC